LDLPFGLKDGFGDIGHFTVASQYRQIVFGKPILGGYLSRISDATRAKYQAMPIPGALMTLSEGRPLTSDDRVRAKASAPAFLTSSRLGYVVVDDEKVSPEMRAFAIDTLDLTETMRGDGFTLFEPRGRP